MGFYNKFSAIHELLKQYGCKATYDFHGEYEEPVTLGGYNFYKPENEMHTDNNRKEWNEEVSAKLDVVVPTKWREAPKRELRFDIDYSNRVNLYSMYITLPTTGRCKSLSRKNYKSQDEIILDINTWLKIAKCSKKTVTIDKKKVYAGLNGTKKAKEIEQLSLFI